MVINTLARIWLELDVEPNQSKVSQSQAMEG